MATRARHRALLAGGALLLLLATPAAAQNASFVAELDRDAVAPGEPFVYQVTLTVAGEAVDNYRPPDFKGLRVVSAPQFPSRSTSMQIGGGQTVVQNGYTWHYELMLPPGAGQTPLTIASARVRVAGRELRSNAGPLGAGGAAGAGRGPPPGGGRPPRGGGPFPGDPFAALFGQQRQEAPPPNASSGAANFIRAVADKPHPFVGEQVTVAWYLYLTQRQD